MDGKLPDNSPSVSELKREFRSSIEGTLRGRTESLKARDYKDGNQFTAEELAVFAKRKQPVVIYNNVRKKVNGLLGYEITRRTDPVAFGRTEKDMAVAATATKVLRFEEEQSRLDMKITAAFENMLVEGTGALELTVEAGKPDYRVKVRQIPWEMWFYDPRSRQPDFSDASYMGVSEWMNVDEAKARFPQNKHEYLTGTTGGGDDLDEHESVEDRPDNHWFDEKRKRVRLVQLWRKSGMDWNYYVFTGEGLIDSGKSPYVNHDDETVHPFIAASGYVDRHNVRHGIVRDLFGPQDEINKRRSKLLHKISEKQFFYTTGAVEDRERTRQELKKPDGVIEVAHGEFGKNFGVMQDTAGLQGQAELLAEAKMQMDSQGLNPALLGRDTGAASGRAILATQQGALAEEAVVFDRLREFKLAAYRALWDRVKQFYRAERVVRITDDKRSPEFIGMNRQVGVSLEGRPIIQNPVAAMNVDIIIEEVADSPVLQAEEFDKILELIQTVPGFSEEVDLVDVLKASSLTNKHEWIEKIEAKREDASQQPPDPMMEQATAIKMAQEKAKADETNASAGLKIAQTDKTRAEIGGVTANTNKTEIEARVLPFEAAQRVLSPTQSQSA